MKSYQLRGTNGSGKTTVARELLKLSNAVPDLHTDKGKIESYEGRLNGKMFFVLGSYESTCGGCDTIPSVGRVAQLLHYYDPLDCVVFFEGLMISHMLGTVGKMQAELGKEKHVLAFLDTPLEVCIERVKARRLERGDEREFDPRNIVADHPRVAQSRTNALKQGFRVADVYHPEALSVVQLQLAMLAGEL